MFRVEIHGQVERVIVEGRPPMFKTVVPCGVSIFHREVLFKHAACTPALSVPVICSEVGIPDRSVSITVPVSVTDVRY